MTGHPAANHRGVPILGGLCQIGKTRHFASGSLARIVPCRGNQIGAGSVAGNTPQGESRLESGVGEASTPRLLGFGLGSEGTVPLHGLHVGDEVEQPIAERGAGEKFVADGSQQRVVDTCGQELAGGLGSSTC